MYLIILSKYFLVALGKRIYTITGEGLNLVYDVVRRDGRPQWILSEARKQEHIQLLWIQR
ncbi:MAG: hypothetical protein RIC03_06780 [Cyclobacteriaceae bacterium]